ncbi:MAG: energy-coupling factor transporter ATPase [Clostridia bacterium]|nr:energy-coupling factor transporter ATPase [Clostridia bacterium]
MNKIELEHVSYVYGPGTPFEKKALDDVTLGIRAGCITGVIGHTGSGKSTMMQLLNGLSAPTDGRVLLDGYDINGTPEQLFDQLRDLPEFRGLSRRALKKAVKAEIIKRRRALCFRVGLVMQYPEYQLFEESVSRDIAFGPQNMGLDEEEIKARVLEAAKFTGISPELLEKSPFDLSGGQKRRVALAGVIAMRPEVLVLDEPAAGLDPQGRDFIFEGISRYQKETGTTVLIVSHSMEDMARYCDDMIVMANGRLLMQGGCKEVFARISELSKVGLDIPQITQLIALLRERGLEIPADIYTVEDAVAAVRRALEGRKEERA